MPQELLFDAVTAIRIFLREINIFPCDIYLYLDPRGDDRTVAVRIFIPRKPFYRLNSDRKKGLRYFMQGLFPEKELGTQFILQISPEVLGNSFVSKKPLDVIKLYC